MSKLKKDFYNSFGFQNSSNQPEFTVESHNNISYSIIRIGSKISSSDYYFNNSNSQNKILRIVYKGYATIGNSNGNILLYNNFLINTEKTKIEYKDRTQDDQINTLNERTFTRIITKTLSFGSDSTKDVYIQNNNVTSFDKINNNQIYTFKKDANYDGNANLLAGKDVSISLRHNNVFSSGETITIEKNSEYSDIETDMLNLDSVYFTQTNEMFQADGSGNFFDYDETLATASSDSDPNEFGIARNNKIPQAILNSINSDTGLPSDKTTCKIIYDFDSSKNNDHRQVLIYKDDSTKTDRSNDAYYFYGVNSNDVEGFNEVDYNSVNNDYLFAMPYSTTYIENGQTKKYRIEYEEYATSNTEDGVKFEYNYTDHIVSVKIPVFLDGSNNGRGGIVEVAGV